MPRFPGLLYVSLALLTAAVLFYVLAVTGRYFEKPTPGTDLGLYSVTFILVGFGAAGLLLRWAKMNAPATD